MTPEQKELLRGAIFLAVLAIAAIWSAMAQTKKPNETQGNKPAGGKCA